MKNTFDDILRKINEVTIDQSIIDKCKEQCLKEKRTDKLLIYKTESGLWCILRKITINDISLCESETGKAFFDNDLNFFKQLVNILWLDGDEFIREDLNTFLGLIVHLKTSINFVYGEIKEL